MAGSGRNGGEDRSRSALDVTLRPAPRPSQLPCQGPVNTTPRFRPSNRRRRAHGHAVQVTPPVPLTGVCQPTCASPCLLGSLVQDPHDPQSTRAVLILPHKHRSPEDASYVRAWLELVHTRGLLNSLGTGSTAHAATQGTPCKRLAATSCHGSVAAAARRNGPHVHGHGVATAGRVCPVPTPAVRLPCGPPRKHAPDPRPGAHTPRGCSGKARRPPAALMPQTAHSAQPTDAGPAQFPDCEPTPPSSPPV